MLLYPICGSAPHSLQDTDLVIVELSYESHLSYVSPDAQQASSRDYSANWRITQRRVENYLASAIRAAIQDSAMRMEYGANAALRARQLFSEEAVFKRIESAYELAERMIG